MAQLEFDDSVAQGIEALYRIREAAERRAIVRRALAAAPGENILDVGCGPGFYCLELAGEVGSGGGVVGVDSSEPMLKLAARRCEGLEQVRFEQGDALSLPVADESFDAALSVQVLEYVPDATAALAEIRRAIRPGGRVLIWDIDWETLSVAHRDEDRFRRVRETWDTHAAHVSLPRTLGFRMREAGFEDVRMTSHAFSTIALDPETYGGAFVELGRSVIAGLGASEEDVEGWAAEMHELDQRGAFFFSVTQFCFTAARP